MKRFLSILFAAVLLLSLCASALGQGAGDLTGEALIAAAQKEIGDNTMKVYSASSRMSKAAADFTAKYNIKIEVTVVKDNEMIEKIATEVSGNVAGADMIFAQNGGRVLTELIEPGYVYSYTPVALREVISADFQNPQAWDIPIKVFIYNSAEQFGAEQPITNVWALTDPQWKGRFHLKDPNSEGVGMNFFTMCIREDWAQKLADAYQAYYGKPIELTTPNAGYEWIKMLYQNGMVLGSSDTDISVGVGTRGQEKQLMGLFTLNKVRSAAEKELDLAPCYNLVPFSGFYYPIYGLIPSNCKYPVTASLFLEYMLSPEGYKYWSGEMGDYSPNPNIVNAEDKVTMEEWTSMLVKEDPQWCADHRWEMEEFIASIQY